MTNPNADIRSKLIAMALEDLRKGDFRKALRRYLRLSGLEPGNPAHLVKLGELHEKLGSADDAVNAWFRAAALFVVDAFDLKAIALYKRGRSVENPGGDPFRGDAGARRLSALRLRSDRRRSVARIQTTGRHERRRGVRGGLVRPSGR